MKTNIVAGSLLAASLAALAFAAPAPAQAQVISADVRVRTGPVRGRVVVDDGYSTYRRHPVVYERPARVIVVERIKGRGRFKHWQRHGYRQVRVYYVDGRYFDRFDRRRGMREVVVYERDGRYYRDDCDDRDHRRDDDRYRDRDRDGDRDWDRNRDHRDHDRWDD